MVKRLDKRGQRRMRPRVVQKARAAAGGSRARATPGPKSHSPCFIRLVPHCLSQGTSCCEVSAPALSSAEPLVSRKAVRALRSNFPTAGRARALVLGAAVELRPARSHVKSPPSRPGSCCSRAFFGLRLVVRSRMDWLLLEARHWARLSSSSPRGDPGGVLAAAIAPGAPSAACAVEALLPRKPA